MPLSPDLPDDALLTLCKELGLPSRPVAVALLLTAALKTLTVYFFGLRLSRTRIPFWVSLLTLCLLVEYLPWARHYDEARPVYSSLRSNRQIIVFLSDITRSAILTFVGMSHLFTHQ